MWVRVRSSVYHKMSPSPYHYLHFRSYEDSRGEEIYV